jgi:hypothetical protein
VIRVRLPEDWAEVPVLELPYAPTLGGLLARLETRCPGTLARLFLPQGTWRSGVEVRIDGRPATDIATPLADGAEVVLRCHG